MVNTTLVVVDDNVRSQEKAKQLLKSILPEHSWCDLEKRGVITIKGEASEYIISNCNQTEIRDLVSGKCTSSACMQLSIPAPIYDRMIAEYLLIKNDENDYLKKVNIFYRPENVFSIAMFFMLAFDIALFLNFIFEVITSTVH